MKLFLGLDASGLEADLKKLKVSLKKAKNIDHEWVGESQRHVPLLSLGEQDSEGLKNLQELLEGSGDALTSLKLKLESVDAYPAQEKGRLIWIGVQHSKDLQSLYEQLVSLLGEAVVEDTEARGFGPYLPIVRLRNHKNLKDVLSPYRNTDFGKLLFENLRIYEMVLSGPYPIYKTLFTLKLKPSL